ncbi:MAG: carboxypeptidase-like regulatory domain-containing protein [Candidatus Sulfotelmatobacter sp.]
MLSGLKGWGSPCGTDGSYEYIFVGSVQSATEVSDTEKRLQLAPQEIFRGDPASSLTVTTSQGACLPEILPGDEWLFYLWRDDKTKELLLGYGGPSEPIADAQPAINLLRRLATMEDAGIIRGILQKRVRRDNHKGFRWTESVNVPNRKVIARRASDQAEYSAVSDDQGNFEFAPLPSGSYHLSANTAPGLWAEEGPATIHARGCEAFDFELQTDGVISGQIKSPDGKVFKRHPWVDVMWLERGESQQIYADEHGHFEARGLEPGRYLVGIGIEAKPDSPEWKSRVYYPGVRTKDKAVIVELGKAAKRTDIDFPVAPLP